MKKNLILQHWNGDLPKWARIATLTVSDYADRIDADYELVRGMPMGDIHGPHTQKLVYLKDKYDCYEQTLMLDMDIVATKESANVFDIPYVGVLHDRAMKGASRTPGAAPTLFKLGKPVFFGNFIKLSVADRVKLRKVWDEEESFIGESVIDHYSGDEIVLHYLIWKSKIFDKKNASELCMRYDDDLMWRKQNRFDRIFANLFKHSPSGPAADEKWGDGSDKNAVFLHFCRDQKKYIERWFNTQ